MYRLDVCIVLVIAAIYLAPASDTVILRHCSPSRNGDILSWGFAAERDNMFWHPFCSMVIRVLAPVIQTRASVDGSVWGGITRSWRPSDGTEC